MKKIIYLICLLPSLVFAGIKVDSDGNIHGSIICTSVDTGQGANELYDMDQNVLTTSTPTFADAIIGGNTYPTDTGTDGYHLTTDGTGTLSWEPNENIVGQVFVISGNSSDVSGYKKLVTLANYTPAARATTTVASTVLNQYVSSATTESGVPGVTLIPAGAWKRHYHLKAGNINRLKLTMEIYKRTAGGVEVDLYSSEQSAYISTSETEYDFYAIGYSTIILSTDRLVTKLKVTTVDVGATTLEIYSGGVGNNETSSRLEAPAFLSNYAPLASPTFTGTLTAPLMAGTTVTASSVTVTGGLTVNGNIVTTGTVDGVDVSGIAAIYSPLASPTFTGTINGSLAIRDDVTLPIVQYSTDSLPVTVSTNPFFGCPTMNNAADQSCNWVRFRYVVPFDVDATTDVYGSLFIGLGGADTSSHTYVVTMSTYTASNALPSTTEIATNPITFTHVADASGGDADLEIITGTLTGYKTGLTAGSIMLIDVARDGNSDNDVSTVNSYLMEFKINIARATKKTYP